MIQVVTLTTDKHYGKQLREIRKSVGMTQTEVARNIGTSSGNISHFEHGDNTRGNGSMKSAIDYAKALGATRLEIEL